MYPASTTFVLGYHGCNIDLANRIFAGQAKLALSENDYDWLGHGTYFWEHNARRAFEFATQLQRRPRHHRHGILVPAVVGAIIDLGNCLNLLDSAAIQLIQDAYRDLNALFNAAGETMPVNSGGPDKILRRADCAVIELLHGARQERGEAAFDTVRAAFVEGSPAYPNAGFHTKNHIQICVRNHACIKGYFRPLDEYGDPLTFG